MDSLIEQINKKQSPCVIGLDPVFEKIPQFLKNGNSNEEIANTILKFNKAIIDEIYDIVPAVKPQLAYYEIYGSAGFKAYEETLKYAKSKNLIVISDAKRGDIGRTAHAYAKAFLEKNKEGTDSDILTVNPYLGTDGITPFIEMSKENNKGIFLLVKTSNESSGEFQDRLVKLNEKEKEKLISLGIEIENDTAPLTSIVALKINELNNQTLGEYNYSFIGAVIGATYPKEAKILRQILKNTFFLVPGYGTQGAKGEDLTNCFDDNGFGAIINSSSGVNFAYLNLKDENANLLYQEEEFAKAARKASLEMIKDIKKALQKAGKLPESWNIN